MRKTVVSLGVLVVILAFGIFLYFKFQASKVDELVHRELADQATEKKECQRRLALFFTAWKQYRADHKGTDPGNIEALIPRYLSDTSLLLCPTAKRWEGRGKRFEQGTLEINKVTVPVSYGIQWLTSGITRSRKMLGDRAPLVTCEVHRQALYQAVFKKGARLGAFDDEQRQHYIPELRDATTLAVLQNGSVTELSPEKLK